MLRSLVGSEMCIRDRSNQPLLEKEIRKSPQNQNMKTDQILKFPVIVDSCVSAIDRLRDALVSDEPVVALVSTAFISCRQLHVVDRLSHHHSLLVRGLPCRPHWLSCRQLSVVVDILNKCMSYARFCLLNLLIFPTPYCIVFVERCEAPKNTNNLHHDSHDMSPL